MKEINQQIEAYQSNNIFDFDDSLVLRYYPQRIYEMISENNNRSTENLSLLELGLGRGYSAEIFSQYFKNYTVLDGDQDIIDQFKINHPNSNINIVKTYFENFTHSQKYDFIVMGFVLEHVNNPLDILCKYREVLKDNGQMFITVPNATSMHRQLGHLAGDLPDMYSLSEADIKLGHKRYFTIDSLKEIVETSGFSVTDIEGLFLKPITTRQMVSLKFKPQYLNAFCLLGKKYPELCNGILIKCKKYP